MQVKINNSKITLLLPKDFKRVENGASLYEEMYHKRKASDIEMFQNLASESYGNVVISHINQAETMSFDKETLIENIHASLTDEQGLIEVERGTNPRGFEYIYSIIKTYHHEELNVNYCVRMNIKNGDELVEVLGSFFESRMTGLRSSMGWNLAMSAGLGTDEASPYGIKNWAEDPYDPQYTKGCRMILCERCGLDGMFPSDPLSQARELALAITEDSYYKTKEEIEAEHKKEKSHKHKKKADRIEKKQEGSDEAKESRQEWLKEMFSEDVIRSGAYKVEIVDDDAAQPEKTSKFVFAPSEITKAASVLAEGAKAAAAKTSANLEKVKTPFEVPDDFRYKLKQPLPKELPGWGKRAYIGFGKRTFAMSGLCLSWLVSEDESLPLNDTNRLIAQYHEDMPENMGLICGKCGITPKGNRYGYAIRKLQMIDEDGKPQDMMNYVVSFNIRINGKIHFIDGSFQWKNGAPGDRRGALEIMRLGSSELKLVTDIWEKDPYDPERKQGFLMNWTENEKFDGLFSYHPLTELRRFVKYVVENN